MGTIRTLIVDDERYAREELTYLLGKFPGVQVVGEAESGEAAILKALQLQPDVVFLDVEMPKMNGIEVAKTLVELKKYHSSFLQPLIHNSRRRLFASMLSIIY